MLSASKLFAILQNINANLTEYQNIYNKQLDYSDPLLLSMSYTEAYMTQDMTKAKILLKRVEEQIELHPLTKRYQLDRIQVLVLMFMIDSSLTLSQKEICFLKNYLMNLKEWGKYDILLFGRCVAIFDCATLSKITNHMINPEMINNKLHYNQHALIQTINNVISIFIEQNQHELASRYIIYLKKSEIHEYYMYDKLTLIYNKAMLEYKKGEASALDTIKECQRIFEFCHCPNTSQLIDLDIEKLSTK